MENTRHILRQAVWHPDEISDPEVPGNPDTSYVFDTWDRLVRESAGRVPGGRAIDLGCGDGRDVIALSRQGFEAWGLDISSRQLGEAEQLASDAGATVHLVRGVNESLPFPDAYFDVVICKSTIDHVYDPDATFCEFARVLRPGGRLIVSAVNYEGITSKLCRAAYAGLRRFNVIEGALERHRFWDSPVPFEHTWEVTHTGMRDLGRRWLGEPEQHYGVSLMWGVPAWGRLLKSLPDGLTKPVLRLLDRPARARPRIADVVIFVWRMPEPAFAPVAVAQGPPQAVVAGR